MTTTDSASTALARRTPPRQPNHLLRQARLRLPSPSGAGRPMSQRELAEAVSAYVQQTTGRDVALDRHCISRWERGHRRLPNADYRAGFRAVLGVGSDAGLGFFRTHHTADEVMDESITVSMPVVEGSMPPQIVVMKLMVKPGMAVIVVPSDHPVLLSLVGGMEPGA